MRVTKIENQGFAPDLHLISDSGYDQLPFKPLGNTVDHIGDKRPGKTVQRPGGLGIIISRHRQNIPVLLNFYLRMYRPFHFTLRTLNRKFLSIYGYLCLLGQLYWQSSYTRHIKLRSLPDFTNYFSAHSGFPGSRVCQDPFGGRDYGNAQSAADHGKLVL